MEQRTNFILFIVICLLILIGWPWLQNQIWPPQPPKKEDDKKAVQKDKTQPPPRVEESRPVAWEQLTLRHKKLATAAAVLSSPGLPLGLLLPWRQAAEAANWKEPVIDQVVLGGKGYFLEAVLTTKGGGVQKLVLTQFKAADYLGRPARDRTGTPIPLQLIQDDPQSASYLMYHYPKEDAKNPWLTLGEAVWEVLGEPQADKVQFAAAIPDMAHRKIIKTYELGKKDYHVTLTLEIQDTRTAGKVEPFRYQLAGPHGLPIEGEWFTSTYRNAVIGMADYRGSLWREQEDAGRISLRAGGDRVPESSRGERFVQYAGIMNQYFAAMIVVDSKQYPVAEGGVSMDKILAWARPTQESSEIKGKLHKQAGLEVQLKTAKEGLLTFLLLPRAKEYLDDQNLAEGDDVVVSYYPAAGKRVATWIRAGVNLRAFSDDLTVRVISEPIELQPGSRVKHKYLLYHGPAKVRLLAQFGGDKAVPDDLVDHYSETLHLRSLTDYGNAFSQAIRWTDILIFFTKLMHWLLYILHAIIPDYGLSIILLTVVVRGLMFPISRKQALLGIRMQAVAPEMKKVQEKFKNDPRAKTEATMELYRKHGVNPLAGCLPILLQLPVFLGLYFALQESIHFRLARFLWIPNLAAPDMLVWWGNGIPWFSDPDNLGGMFYFGPYFNLLPIVAVILMIIQQKMLTPPPQDEQQATQQKILKYMMVFIGIMFYKVAAGLCIYFIASSMWGVAERQLLPKKKTGLPESPVPEGPAAGKGLRTKPRTGAAAKKEDGAFQKVKDWWAELLKKAEKK